MKLAGHPNTSKRQRSSLDGLDTPLFRSPSFMETGPWERRSNAVRHLAIGGGKVLVDALQFADRLCEIGFSIGIQITSFDLHIGKKAIKLVTKLRSLAGGSILEKCIYAVSLPLVGFTLGLLAWLGLQVGVFWGQCAARIAGIATPIGWGKGFAKAVVPLGILALLVPTEKSVRGLRLLGEIIWFADAATFASLTMSRLITRASLRSTAAALPKLQESGFPAALDAARSEVATVLFSQTMLERLQVIWCMICRFVEMAPDDMRIRYLGDSWRALRHLQRTAGVEPAGHHSLIQNLEGGSDIQRFVCFALGMHGHAGLKFLGAIPYGSVQQDEDAVAYCAEIPPDDVVLSEWEGRLHMPGAAIAIDKSTKSIVVAFRGSLWPQDAITDLDCEPRECDFCGHHGVAHAGMLTAAEKASSELAPVVIRLLEMPEHEDFRVMLTGHSLGAGVAALVTAIWLSSTSPLTAWSSRLWCIGFGMPAITSPCFHSAPILKERITAVVCGADVVPRFSLGSSLRLRNAVLALWAQRGAEAALAIKDKTAAANQLRSLLQADGDDAQALCPLGRVIWVPPSGTHVVVLEDPCNSLRDMQIIGSVFEPHLPQNYAVRICGL